MRASEDPWDMLDIAVYYKMQIFGLCMKPDLLLIMGKIARHSHNVILDIAQI